MLIDRNDLAARFVARILAGMCLTLTFPALLSADPPPVSEPVEDAANVAEPNSTESAQVEVNDQGAELGVLVADSPGIGVLVQEVRPHGPAAQAAIRAGDFIMALNGKPIELPGELMSAIRASRIGEEVVIDVWRDGQATAKTVTLSVDSMVDSSGRAWMGITLDPTSQSGVRISSVMPGSPAEASGLQAGDVVTVIDDQAMLTAADLMNAVRQRNPRDVMTVTVRRGEADVPLQVQLGAMAQTPYSSFRNPSDFWNRVWTLPDGTPAPPVGIEPGFPWRQKVDRLREEVEDLRQRLRGQSAPRSDGASGETTEAAPQGDLSGASPN